MRFISFGFGLVSGICISLPFSSLSLSFSLCKCSSVVLRMGRQNVVEPLKDEAKRKKGAGKKFRTQIF